MLKICIPKRNSLELTYIVKTIFGTFLGLKFEIVYDIEVNSYFKIILKNGNKLFIKNSFFSKYSKNLEYLNIKSIPKNVIFGKNKFLKENNIPILYGNDKVIVQPNKIQCEIDVFASSFFMLTRWEEYVINTRDNHNRFKGINSLAFRFKFLDRPIVNEYVEMIWNMICYLGYDKKRKKRTYNLLLTHDVDVPLKYPKISSGIKEILGDIVIRKNFSFALKNLLLKLKTSFKLIKDPFNTFEFLMDLSEKNNIKSYFFFMAKGSTKYDNYYKSSDEFIRKLITKIKKRGHFIGIHPTYNTYDNIDQFKSEKKELIDNFNMKSITFGRHHYLRFEAPKTWQIWEDNGMEWDSTLSYADIEGFRCGVCYEFQVFNFLTQKQLKLKERPLIVMDGSFATYQRDFTEKEVILKIITLQNIVKKYQGEFVFLWHNSSFNTPFWEKYKNVYQTIIKS